MGERKVVLRQTPRAVLPCGRLSVFVGFLHKMGFRKQASRDLVFIVMARLGVAVKAGCGAGLGGTSRLVSLLLLECKVGREAGAGERRAIIDRRYRNSVLTGAIRESPRRM